MSLKSVVRGCYEPRKQVVVLECASGYDEDSLSRLHSELEGEHWAGNDCMTFNFHAGI